ncbi:heterokaryon incompatibility domain-containing protein [Trichoderma gracile]
MGLFIFRRGKWHEDFAKTPRSAKKPPQDAFSYDFFSVKESSLQDPRTTLCQHCSVLHLKDVKIVQEDTSRGRKPPELKADVPGFEADLVYHRRDVVPHLPQMAESADSGCGFCVLLRNAIIQHFRQYPLGRLPDDAIEIVRIRHYWNSGLSAFTVHSPAFVRPGYRFGYLTFRVSVDPTDPCASMFDIGSERVPESVISPAGIFTMKQWVYGKGEEKAALQTLYRPSRLICVESRKESGVIRLVDSDDAGMGEKPQPYLALSYCWGRKAPSLVTTKSNYAHLKSSISHNSLPKLYRDAVRLAQVLGIKYIWIDALCIIQDDVDDWERESQTMADIFRNSLVTVIPLCAASTDEGFLERNPNIKILYHSDEWNVSGSFFIRHMPFSYENAESAIRNGPSFSDRPVSLELQNSVWQTRGWTFQEDMFSIRKLYFGQLMMYWDSLRPVDVLRTEDKIINDKLDRIDTAELSLIHSSGPWRGDYDYDGWYYPILQYSKKKLTYESDRLPAVSSYAKLIASRSRDTYLAGLWKNNLHRGLLWKTQRVDRPTFGTLMQTLARPSAYIAPSWSWASRRGALDLDNSDEMKLECEILEAKTRARGGDAYGRVRGGHLLVRGKSCGIPGGRLRKLPLGTPYMDMQCEWLALEDEQYVAQCALDWRLTNEQGNQLSEASGQSIEAIVMLVVSSGHTATPSTVSRRPHDWEDKDDVPSLEVMHGLLLYPTGKADDEYWRVGLFHSLADEKGGRQYFDRCDERTLRIV